MFSRDAIRIVQERTVTAACGTEIRLDTVRHLLTVVKDGVEAGREISEGAASCPTMVEEAFKCLEDQLTEG